MSFPLAAGAGNFVVLTSGNVGFIRPPAFRPGAIIRRCILQYFTVVASPVAVPVDDGATSGDAGDFGYPTMEIYAGDDVASTGGTLLAVWQLGPVSQKFPELMSKGPIEVPIQFRVNEVRRYIFARCTALGFDANFNMFVDPCFGTNYPSEALSLPFPLPLAQK